MTPRHDMPRTSPVLINALTVDVEDYFQVSAFDSSAKRLHWDAFERRVERNTDRLLELFARRSVTATFFVLGWVADRHPGLVKRIASAGHELASHGYEHRLVYDMTPDEFRADLRRAHDAIGAAAGVEVRAFRAPSFSITERSLWALEVLVEEGYTLDSSIYPIYRDRYGIPNAPRGVHEIVTASGRIMEAPMSTSRVAGLQVPVAGGGYFRLYPYAFTRRAVAGLNMKEHLPAIVYLHPWETDPEQPRQRGSALSTFRHYVNLAQTAGRLERLLTDFRFGPLSQVVEQATSRAQQKESSEWPERAFVLAPTAGHHRA